VWRGSVASLAVRPDGGVAAAGWTEARTEVFALALDSAGCIASAWRAPVPEPLSRVAAVVALPEGALVVAGTQDLQADGRPDGRVRSVGWVGRMNPGGSLAWNLSVSGFFYEDENLPSVTQERAQQALLAGDRLLVAGAAAINGVLFGNWLLSLSPDGEDTRRTTIRRDRLAETAEVTAIAADPQGGLAAAIALGDSRVLFTFTGSGAQSGERGLEAKSGDEAARLALTARQVLLAGSDGDRGAWLDWLDRPLTASSPGVRWRVRLADRESDSLRISALLPLPKAPAQPSHQETFATWAGIDPPAVPVVLAIHDEGPAGGAWLIYVDPEENSLRELAYWEGRGRLDALAVSGPWIVAAGQDLESGLPLILRRAREGF